jgi:hypothetical protein
VAGGIIIQQVVIQQGNLIAANSNDDMLLSTQPRTSSPPNRQPHLLTTSKSNSVSTSRPDAGLEFAKTLEVPGGAVRLGSLFYVAREGVDDRLYREIVKSTGTTTTIRGPRQVGKTSLLIRAEDVARNVGRHTVYLDLQSTDSSQLTDLDSFLHYLATVMVTELCLEPSKVKQAWQSPLGPADKINYLLKDYLLPTIKNPFLLVMDEVEGLLDKAFHDDFFGLVRGWHNWRARNSLWDKLHTIMVISTEPHLLIENERQSPFNVGLGLELDDFSVGQVYYLNEQYQAHLSSQNMEDMMRLLGGHPYLTQQAMYTIVIENLTWPEFSNVAVNDAGPFGTHLRRNLTLLQKHPQLAQAMQQIIEHQNCPNRQLFHHLLRSGLVKGMSQLCECRCRLYEQYFRERL